MSLLPQRIPPPGTAFLDDNGAVSKEWWLFFYNIAAQVLGGQVDLSGILLQLQTEIDSEELAPSFAQSVPETDFPVVFPPDLTALLALEVPASNQAQTESTLVPSISPVVYTALSAGTFLVTGGTVSQIEVARSGTYYSVGAPVIALARLDRVRVTWSVAPTFVFFPS